ncbi:MAG: GNAT family N-acetyltransferase [Bdellovibrio sp.]
MNTLLELVSWPKSLFRIPKKWEINFSPRFLSYVPTHEIYIETNKYILKSAQRHILDELFELRYQIFLEDGTEDEEINYDVDQYDHICDHIVIIDKETNRIVGTYRLLSSDWTEHFYSQNEFYLDRFLIQAGVKIELGRACIHHGHRNGAVIDLLWRGIGEYCMKTNAKYLFGCSSVKTTLRKDALQLMSYFESQENLASQYCVHPIGKFDMKILDQEISNFYSKNEMSKELVPPLLRSYLMAGAKVHGAPALDIDFHCIDFLTIMDLNNLNPSYRKRYFKVQND